MWKIIILLKILVTGHLLFSSTSPHKGIQCLFILLQLQISCRSLCLIQTSVFPGSALLLTTWSFLSFCLRNLALQQLFHISLIHFGFWPLSHLCLLTFLSSSSLLSSVLSCSSYQHVLVFFPLVTVFLFLIFPFFLFIRGSCPYPLLLGFVPRPCTKFRFHNRPCCHIRLDCSHHPASYTCLPTFFTLSSSCLSPLPSLHVFLCFSLSLSLLISSSFLFSVFSSHHLLSSACLASFFFWAGVFFASRIAKFQATKILFLSLYVLPTTGSKIFSQLTSY